jgi:hypothetical protein
MTCTCAVRTGSRAHVRPAMVERVRVSETSLQALAAAVTGAAAAVDARAADSAAGQVEGALATSSTAGAMRALSSTINEHTHRWLDSLTGWGDEVRAASDAYAARDASTRSRFQMIAR